MDSALYALCSMQGWLECPFPGITAAAVAAVAAIPGISVAAVAVALFAVVAVVAVVAITAGPHWKAPALHFHAPHAS
jgi:hypothetical protein